jgi:hypothetical protein
LALHAFNARENYGVLIRVQGLFMELLTLVAQTVLVGLLAGWLVIGAYENIRAPEVNLALVREVFSMEAIAREMPGVYELVKPIASPRDGSADRPVPPDRGVRDAGGNRSGSAPPCSAWRCSAPSM